MPKLNRIYAALENRILDFWHTGGTLTKQTAPINKDIQATTPTDWHILNTMFARFHFSANDYILDVGTGRGRSLLFLRQRFPQSRISGIEINPIVAAEAMRVNPGADVIVGDILKLCPREANVFYLFNPFHGELLRKFCVQELNTRQSYVLIYLVPAYLDVIREHCTGNLRIQVYRIRNRLRGIDREFAVVEKSASA